MNEVEDGGDCKQCKIVVALSTSKRTWFTNRYLVVFQSHPFGLSDTCPGCNNPYSAGAVSNQLTVAIRRHIKEYYMVTKPNFET